MLCRYRDEIPGAAQAGRSLLPTATRARPGGQRARRAVVLAVTVIAAALWSACQLIIRGRLVQRGHGGREGGDIVPAETDTPRTRRPISKGRMEAFSDGVFAIAATLLVLDVAVHPPGTPLEQVLHAWPAYVAYVVSFLTIGGAWLAHTALTDRLAQSDSIFLRLNLLVLLVVAFLPFPTRLVADALQHTDAERVAVTIYGLTLLAIRLLGSALAEYARREHLYSPPGEGEEPPGEQRKLLPVVIGYVTAILIGLLLPGVAVALYFGIAVYLVVPFREVARLLFRPS